MRNHDITLPGGFATGCNYWASHAGTAMWSDWKPDVVDADLAQLASSGLTTIRVFPLWPVFQPLIQTYGGAGRPHDLRFGEAPLPDTVTEHATEERGRVVVLVNNSREEKPVTVKLNGRWTVSGVLFAESPGPVPSVIAANDAIALRLREDG